MRFEYRVDFGVWLIGVDVSFVKHHMLDLYFGPLLIEVFW